MFFAFLTGTINPRISMCCSLRLPSFQPTIESDVVKYRFCSYEQKIENILLYPKDFGFLQTSFGFSTFGRLKHTMYLSLDISRFRELEVGLEH